MDQALYHAPLYLALSISFHVSPWFYLLLVRPKPFFFSKIIKLILGAAFSWWLVTILIWGFSIIFEWNISTVEKNGNYIHIFAWSPPAILTLLAAHNEKVKT